MTGSKELCISIQDRIIKVVVCSFNKKKNIIEVYKAFELEIPEDFSTSKNEINLAAIVGFIKQAFRDNKITLKKYNLCISDRSIITRVIKLPRMDMRDLKNFMKLSIQQYFPIKGQDYCFDYKIQRINDKDEKAYYNLLLVAIPKSLMNYYTGILLKCGLKPKKISIYSDVVFDMFSALAGEDIAILEAGYNYTEFIMIENKTIFINSIINYAIPKNNEQNINEESYLSNLRGSALGEDFLTTTETLRNYLNFFSSRHHGKNIEEIYFIGEGAMLKEVILELESNLNINITSGKKFLINKVKTSGMPKLMKEEFKPERFCSCLGLVVGGTKNEKYI